MLQDIGGWFLEEDQTLNELPQQIQQGEQLIVQLVPLEHISWEQTIMSQESWGQDRDGMHKGRVGRLGWQASDPGLSCICIPVFFSNFCLKWQKCMGLVWSWLGLVAWGGLGGGGGLVTPASVCRLRSAGHEPADAGGREGSCRDRNPPHRLLPQSTIGPSQGQGQPFFFWTTVEQPEQGKGDGGHFQLRVWYNPTVLSLVLVRRTVQTPPQWNSLGPLERLVRAS